MGFFSKLFGGSDDSAQRKTAEDNKQRKAFIEQMQGQARGDVLALAPGAEQNLNLGSQAALDVYGQTIPQQFDVFQQGNVGAQGALLAGMPQVHNAIMGAPIDYSAFQPQALNYNARFSQQQLPNFASSTDMLGGEAVAGGQERQDLPQSDTQFVDRTVDPHDIGNPLRNPRGNNSTYFSPGFGMGIGMAGGSGGAGGIDLGGAGPASGGKAWMIDHGDELAGLLGGFSGITGMGTGANKFVDWLTNKYFWDRGGTFQNPSQNANQPSLLEQQIADYTVGAHDNPLPHSEIDGRNRVGIGAGSYNPFFTVPSRIGR